MSYLALPVAQMQTGPFGSSNCGPSATELLIKLASVDAMDVSAAKIRTASGDKVGGIEGGLLASTANKLTGNIYPISYQHTSDWKAVLDRLEHSSLAFIIRCSVTIKTKYRTNSFTGNHWVTAGGGTIKDGTIKVEDPGTTMAGWMRWPIPLLKEASSFAGNHWFLTSPRTEDTDKLCLHTTGVRASPDRQTKRIGSIQTGETIHVIKTTKGGPWLRNDGTVGRGWHKIDFKGGVGYCKGESLR